MEDSTNLPRTSPLPITITPGMQVVRVEDNPIGRIAGITAGYCAYTLGGAVWVDRWNNLALLGVCPASPLLPSAVAENDRLDACARVLRELALLKSLGELTQAQRAAINELTGTLCATLNLNSES